MEGSKYRLNVSTYSLSWSQTNICARYHHELFDCSEVLANLSSNQNILIDYYTTQEITDSVTNGVYKHDFVIVTAEMLAHVLFVMSLAMFWHC